MYKEEFKLYGYDFYKIAENNSAVMYMQKKEYQIAGYEVHLKNADEMLYSKEMFGKKAWSYKSLVYATKKFKELGL